MTAQPEWPFHIADPTTAVHHAIERDCEYRTPEHCPNHRWVEKVIDAYRTWAGHHTPTPVEPTADAAALDRVRAVLDAVDRERNARDVDGEEPLNVTIDAAIRTVQYVTVHRVRRAIEEPTQ